jgi:hypothetical protein
VGLMTGSQVCPMCDEEVTEAQDVLSPQGLPMVVDLPVLEADGSSRIAKAHRECMFSNVMGHAYKACGCFCPDLTVREQALLAWHKATAGGQPVLA